MPETLETIHLEDLWNEEQAKALVGNQLSLLRYRSNLLGADLRITNFGGGNTSSKIELPDPFTGKAARVLAVKGSGGQGHNDSNRRSGLPPHYHSSPPADACYGLFWPS